MATIVLILWVVLAFFTFVSPPIALMLYGFIGSDSDAYAVTNLLGLINTNQKFVTRGLFLLASFIILYRLQKVYKNTSNKVIKVSVVLALVLSILIVLNSMIKDMGITKSLSIYTYSGLPVFLIWLSTANSPDFRKLFYAFITINIIVAVAVLFFPFMKPLDGRNYQELSAFTDGGVRFSLPDPETNKVAIGQYAQYHNPNALGFYSCVAIICGLALISKATLSNISKFWGMSLIVFGIIAWLNSLSRGPAIAVFISFFSWQFFPAEYKKKNLYSWMKNFVISLISLLIAVIMFLLIYKYLILTPDNVSVTARLEGYRNGYAAILEYPILGFDANFEWPSLGAYPHFLPLLFAAQNGIIVGVLVTILVFVIGFIALINVFKSLRSTLITPFNAALSLGLILVVWSIASTNNLTAVVLFWVCLAEAYIRIYYNTPPNQVMRKRRMIVFRKSR